MYSNFVAEQHNFLPSFITNNLSILVNVLPVIANEVKQSLLFLSVITNTYSSLRANAVSEAISHVQKRHCERSEAISF